jgi:hypothetical protein
MDLPPEDTLRALVARYAGLRARHGDAIGDPELLEPSSRHFPDDFAGDAESVAQLLRRMIAYAPLADDLPIAIAFGGGAQAAGGCGTGACGGEPSDHVALGGVVELEDGYRVDVARPELANPVLLAASLARSVGGLVLAEAEEEVVAKEHGAMSEVAAVATGFGLLVIGGAALYAKGCGGLRMHRVTHLDVSELAVLVALFARVHGAKPGAVRAHLETTPKEAFDEALRWVDSNESIVARLRDAPESLQAGLFSFEPVRGALGRFFSRKNEPPPPSAPRAASTKSEAELRRIAETKALVDEALRET